MHQNKKVTNKKKLDDTFEQAFESGEESLPNDTYFQKIWTSIENRAPVGEKYYLRSFLTIFFIILFVAVFILFYTDFLSSVLTLKEIRKENTAKSSRVSAPIPSAYSWSGSTTTHQSSPAPGIDIQWLENTAFQVIKKRPDKVELKFLLGHGVISAKANENRSVIVNLPDLVLRFNEGRVNIFCYDNIIRIIPLSHRIFITSNGKTLPLEPGQTFYLLDKKTIIQ
jgi:hypothetical protein